MADRVRSGPRSLDPAGVVYEYCTRAPDALDTLIDG